MGAPVAQEHCVALDQLGRALVAVLASAAARSAIDSADDRQPPEAGARPQTHDDQVSEPASADLVAAEGDRRDRVTSTADAF